LLSACSWCSLLCYAISVSSKKARDIEICFNIRSHKQPWGCPKYHQSYKTKAIIHQFAIPWLTVIQHKNGSSCQGKSTSVRGNNVLVVSGTAITIHTGRPWWLNMQNKQLWSGKYLKIGNTKNGTYTNSMQKFFVWILRQNEMPALCNIISRTEPEILSLVEGAMCNGRRETGFLLN
jgi:hypothetical protein